jgi:hypothetical protein
VPQSADAFWSAIFLTKLKGASFVWLNDGAVAIITAIKVNRIFFIAAEFNEHKMRYKDNSVWGENPNLLIINL